MNKNEEKYNGQIMKLSHIENRRVPNCLIPREIILKSHLQVPLTDGVI